MGLNMLQVAGVDDVEEFEEEETQVMFTQITTTVPENWVLLDSQSTVCVFRCNKYLNNIRQSDKRLRLITNGGEQISTLVGDLPNFGTVWYNPNSLANILSMADVRKRCRITMDSEKEAAILGHRTNRSVMKFSEFNSGLYYYDADKHSNPTVNNYCFTQTVEKNKKMFHHREIEGAESPRPIRKDRKTFRKVFPTYPSKPPYQKLPSNC